MPQVTHTITINRPISEVFRFAVNFNNAKQWQRDVTETYQSEENVRVGIMVSQRRTTRLFGWKLDLNADVVDYAPNKLLGYKGVLGRFPMYSRMEFTSMGGSTQIIHTYEIRMGFLYGLFSGMMKGVMTRRTRQSLEALKKLMESRSATSTTVTDFHKQL